MTSQDQVILTTAFQSDFMPKLKTAIFFETHRLFLQFVSKNEAPENITS